MPDLKKQVKEATTRCQEARKAMEQKAKVDDLKKELAWAHVKAKENVRLLPKILNYMLMVLLFESGNES